LAGDLTHKGVSKPRFLGRILVVIAKYADAIHGTNITSPAGGKIIFAENLMDDVERSDERR